MLYSLEKRQPQVAADVYVADNASVIGSVILEAGSSVWFNCVLRGDNDDIIVGERSNVQDGSVLHTDSGLKLNIGREVTIGHQVMLHGCSIGDGALIGIGSRVLNGAVIGAESIVAAGSVVPEGKTFPDGVMLMGTPVKIVRELSEQQRKALRMPAQLYVQNAQRYMRELKPFAPTGSAT